MNISTKNRTDNLKSTAKNWTILKAVAKQRIPIILSK